jgi:hypothetical protein
VPPTEHGLALLGDHKALVADGNCLIGSRNDGPLWRAEHANAVAADAWRLSGPAGNPQRIGARLRQALADGRVRASELAAGGSYLSQSPPAWRFERDYQSAAVRLPDGSREDWPATKR